MPASPGGRCRWLPLLVYFPLMLAVCHINRLLSVPATVAGGYRLKGTLMRSLHVLLVDDSLEFLEAAAQFLAAQPEITIVGCATSGAMALEKVAALKPDLVLM